MGVGKCVELRKGFESSCPPTWVKHFDRKFQYEKFKKQMEAVNWQGEARKD